MKVSDIPFNMKTSYNSAFHEGPNDIDEMKKGVDFLFEKLSTGTSYVVKAYSDGKLVKETKFTVTDDYWESDVKL